jgi:hypothetical protein
MKIAVGWRLWCFNEKCNPSVVDVQKILGESSERVVPLHTEF